MYDCLVQWCIYFKTGHINYIKDFIGVDFVGIGADYDGVPT